MAEHRPVVVVESIDKHVVVVVVVVDAIVQFSPFVVDDAFSFQHRRHRLVQPSRHGAVEHLLLTDVTSSASTNYAAAAMPQQRRRHGRVTLRILICR